MKTVEQIAAEIVAREGGYVNDPDDPGGATNYGVTLATLQRLGIDRTGDGRIDVADIRALTRADAQRIFVEHYFRKPRLAELPIPIQASVFDMYVNAGTNAVKILQRLCTRMGFAASDDGLIGPRTILAAQQAEAAAQGYFADAYGIARRNYYYALGDARPASRKYARTRAGGKGGWITRAEEFISARYHLSAAQHRERTAAWG
ncbi:holin-associated N-acetylmuramidase [Paracoccus laeviglucosivorans]|uniref:Predicted Peptidoglycan domain-containing protein n=1 Tax=Paracoccus laeviglucosivorans TaxID=1197861 RepID=A0A521C756_9RHOB|nr:holin-associated N-acetylmuramidase [Paracoccus laeviglucosivorans]SMO55312.1 Predicted Peptidoglycan domain-containing protein [Paracoccus laeviglucosivorans]